MSPIHLSGGKGLGKRNYQRLRLATSRLKVFVWVDDDDMPYEGFGFLADFSASGIGVYLSSNLPKGKALRLALEFVDGNTYRGTVVWCQRYTLEQNFFGHEALSFRLGVKLNFGSEAERQRYLEYWDTVKTRALSIEPGIRF